jgi:uncharacterized protein (TIGR02246 family)
MGCKSLSKGFSLVTLGIFIALSIAIINLTVPAAFSSDSVLIPNLGVQQAKAKPGQIKQMQRDQIQSLIQKARDAWMRLDAEAWANLFIEQGELVVPGDRWLGRAALRKAVVDYGAAYTNVKIEIRRVLIEDNQALVEWYWQAQEKATGRIDKADDAIVVDVQDQRIARWREYIDTKTPNRRS